MGLFYTRPGRIGLNALYSGVDRQNCRRSTRPRQRNSDTTALESVSRGPFRRRRQFWQCQYGVGVDCGNGPQFHCRLAKRIHSDCTCGLLKKTEMVDCGVIVLHDVNGGLDDK